MVRHQNDCVGDHPITHTNGVESMFQRHGNQLLKFHFLPFLTDKEKTIMRSTCQTLKQNIPKPQYSYFKTIGMSSAIYVWC